MPSLAPSAAALLLAPQGAAGQPAAAPAGSGAPAPTDSSDDDDDESAAGSLPPLVPMPSLAPSAAALLSAQGAAGQPAAAPAAVPPPPPLPASPVMSGVPPSLPLISNNVVPVSLALPDTLPMPPSLESMAGFIANALMGGGGDGGDGLVDAEGGAEAAAALLQAMLPTTLSPHQAQALQAQLVHGLSAMLGGPGGGQLASEASSLAAPLLSAMTGAARGGGAGGGGASTAAPLAEEPPLDESAAGSAAPWFPRVLPGHYDPVAHHPIRRELARLLQYAPLAPPEQQQQQQQHAPARGDDGLAGLPPPGCTPQARAVLQGTAELVWGFLQVGGCATHNGWWHSELRVGGRGVPGGGVAAQRGDPVLHGDVLLYARQASLPPVTPGGDSASQADAAEVVGSSVLVCNPLHLLLLGVAVAPTLAHAAHHACMCYAVALLQGVDAAATYARQACLLLACLAPTVAAAAASASAVPAAAACSSPLVDGFLGFVAGFGAHVGHLLKESEAEAVAGAASAARAAPGSSGAADAGVCALLRRFAPAIFGVGGSSSSSGGGGGGGGGGAGDAAAACSAATAWRVLGSAHCHVLRLLAASPFVPRTCAEQLLSAASSAPQLLLDGDETMAGSGATAVDKAVAQAVAASDVAIDRAAAEALAGGRLVASLPAPASAVDANHLRRQLQRAQLPQPRPRVERLCLVDLPHAYEALYAALGAAKCTTGCRKRPANAALCLVCGVLVCAGGDCCRVQGVGEATRHAAVCGAGTGVLLQLASTGVLLLRGGLAIDYGSPYADAHGEPDLGLKRGKPLFLSARRYAALGELWARGGDLAREVSRVRASADRVYRVNFY